MASQGDGPSNEVEGDDFEALLLAPTIPAPDTADDHSAIVHIQEEGKGYGLKAYVEDFDGVIPAAEVVVASIPLEVVQQRELELEQARIKRAQDEAKEFQMRETLLAYKEQKARDRLAEAAAEHTKKMAAKELQSLHVVKLQSQSLWHVYHQAETHLKNVLTRQQAHVENTYGTMSVAPTSHLHAQRRYRTEWAFIPQPIEIHVHMLRAVKDKLPQGHYVLLATLYDRLGGSPITWSVAGDRGVGSSLPGLTTPLIHRGHFYNTELHVDQNVYVVCPPQQELRPGATWCVHCNLTGMDIVPVANVVLFELYLLSGANATKDCVVAWGVLPVCNADFDVVAGRFKVPMMRGDVDHTISKFHVRLFADMGLNKAGTLQFWLMVIFLCMALWLRLYVHYLGQWLYLRAVNVPVFAFSPQLVTVVLKYTWNTVPTSTEIGVIAVGVVFNVLTFLGLMGIASASQRFLGEFPDIGSRFIACFGLGTVLDPVLVFAIDLLHHNYDCASLGTCTDPSSSSCKCSEGDAFKLYQRFKSEEGTGVVGAVLTLLVYGFLMGVAAVVFYTYLLHFHMNGRMLDVYRRIHAREGMYFVPNDFEVSNADVTVLCDKAARWKSMTGTQRKTAVCEYELRDPLDPSFVETTVHIAIFNLELDGSRQLYRHFIKNPDGEILEVFGAISDSLGSQYAALESVLFQTAPPDHDIHTGLFDSI
ncbi:hypothetical protein DYB32_000356 [Aphanomyces invadans]|uniref:Uncharacterized protein n=1 Tax=Aphanomyces invadans TaxID=157072 RepID=A0A418BA73_9STRA|nr:hypothetical protein DYB32_000356 [Aphanomyces invadans]